MSKLKDYVVTFDGTKPDATYLNVSGNFFKIVSVKLNTSTIPTANMDLRVKLTFDDQDVIVRRPAEGGARNYQRVKIQVLGDDGSVLTSNTYTIQLVLGEGSLYTDRTRPPVPFKAVTYMVTCAASTETTFSLPETRSAIKTRIELNTAVAGLTEMYFTFETSIPILTANMTIYNKTSETFDYAGEFIRFYNPAAAPVVVRVTQFFVDNY